MAAPLLLSARCLTSQALSNELHILPCLQRDYIYPHSCLCALPRLRLIPPGSETCEGNSQGDESLPACHRDPLGRCKPCPSRDGKQRESLPRDGRRCNW